MGSSTDPTPFLTTLAYRHRPEIVARAHFIDPTPRGNRSPLAALGVLLRVLRAARHEKALLLDSTSGPWYPDVLAAVVIGFWPRRKRPAVVLMGDMWEPSRSAWRLVEGVLIRLADRGITLYALQSSEEVANFPRLWGVDPAKARLSLYFYTLSEEEVSGAPEPTGDYVFAGGNAHRDYAPLIEAARRMPETRFMFATSRISPKQRAGLPPNVRAEAVPHDEFVRLMRGAAAVVVPIRRGLQRAAGQQTYLNAMMLYKPTIIPDGYGVRDHVIDGENALVVDGTPEGYHRALSWVLDPANRDQVERLKLAAREAAAQFSFSHHTARLMELVDEALRLTGRS
ncbi:MAG: hypothetical protein Kow00124_24550 [Anaerolineae bacterium]